MPTLNESNYPGEVLLSHAPGTLSFDKATLASGQNLKAGTVLGKLTSGGHLAAYDNDASDGTQTAVAILYADTDASAAATPCTVIARLAEVASSKLVWGAAVTTTPEKTAAYVDLAALHIIARE